VTVKASGGGGSVATDLAITVTDVDGVNYTGTANPDVVPDATTTLVTDEEDVILGMAQADNLSGGGGNDYIDGGAGADTVVGGMGKDVLIGNFGNDTFVYRSMQEGHQGEEILDFARGADKIGIVSSGFNGISGISLETYNPTGADYGNNGFVYDGSTGRLYFNDASGASEVLKAIAKLDDDADALTGFVPTLSQNDFTLII
jgi:Ca2+-binding RTX toxin-like protein